MAPGDDDAAEARSLKSWRAPLGLAVALVVADQVTKHWALNRLSDDRVIDVVWTLRFNLAFNRGMAFSQGQGLGPLIAVVATLVIVWLLVSLRSTGGRLNTFGIGCVIGGAAGNLIDRAFRQEAWLRGAVVDFIDFQWFPIFNIADIAINVGAAALILNAVLSAREAGRIERELALTPAMESDASVDPGAAESDDADESSTDDSAAVEADLDERSEGPS
ncbi:MAG: signal peptidase II [Ilumatobacter sp.]